MLEIGEVRAITDKWEALAPGMIEMFKKIPII
jgi:hypothetical protein